MMGVGNVRMVRGRELASAPVTTEKCAARTEDDRRAKKMQTLQTQLSRPELDLLDCLGPRVRELRRRGTAQSLPSCWVERADCSDWPREQVAQGRPTKASSTKASSKSRRAPVSKAARRHERQARGEAQQGALRQGQEPARQQEVLSNCRQSTLLAHCLPHSRRQRPAPWSDPADALRRWRWPLLQVGAASEHIRGPVKLTAAEPSHPAQHFVSAKVMLPRLGTESATDRESIAILPWNAHLVSLGPPLCRLT